MKAAASAPEGEALLALLVAELAALLDAGVPLRNVPARPSPRSG